MPARGPAVPSDIRKAIALRTMDGDSATQIHQWLKNSSALKGRHIPAPRTVQKIVRELKSVDTSDPWRPVESEEDAGTTRYLLDVLAEIMSRPSGEITFADPSDDPKPRWVLTLETVDVLKGIRKAAPDIPKWEAYRLARYYLVRTTDSTDDLDMLLAFAPWRSREARNRFRTALKDSGWLTEDDPRMGNEWTLPVSEELEDGTILSISERGDAWLFLLDIANAIEKEASDDPEAPW